MKFIVLFLINAYQKLISPWLPRACRFYPSCSEYAKESFKRHSLLRAFGLTTKRICKCHPYHEGGVDLVP